MFKVIVERECGCFKRSDMQNNLELTSKDEALLKSLQMKDKMNNEFCSKHKFQVKETEDSFVIVMD